MLSPWMAGNPAPRAAAGVAGKTCGPFVFRTVFKFAITPWAFLVEETELVMRVPG